MPLIYFCFAKLAAVYAWFARVDLSSLNMYITQSRTEKAGWEVNWSDVTVIVVVAVAVAYWVVEMQLQRKKKKEQEKKEKEKRTYEGG